MDRDPELPVTVRADKVPGSLFVDVEIIDAYTQSAARVRLAWHTLPAVVDFLAQLILDHPDTFDDPPTRRL